MRFVVAVGLMVQLGATAAVVGQVIYATPFESPIFTPGNLSGQSGWMSFDDPPTPGRAVVENAFSWSGSQAVSINAAASNTTGWFWKPLNASVPVATASVIQITWRMYLDGTVLPLSDGWGIDVYEGLAPTQRRLYTVFVDSQGALQLLSAFQFVNSGVVIPRNTWHLYRVDLNLAPEAMRANVYVDGALVSRDLPLGTTIAAILSDVDLFNIDGSGMDSAYYDDLTVLAVADSDHDGFPNTSDNCPNTAPAAPVDASGCSLLDSDGDGVRDDFDQCPATPPCAGVNSAGCPSDTDGDGILNGCDACPNTAPAAPVDPAGCSLLDSDGDGVRDDFDLCPATPICATMINSVGCPTDTDGDGLFDGCDPCPNRRPGDVNGDGQTNGLDVQRFTYMLLHGPGTPDELCAADFNGDELLSRLDIPGFVQAVLAG